MADETNVISRSYTDNFSVKEFINDTLVPKYFPDIDVSKRTVGTIGYTGELISNISEDVFNSLSVLFTETFVNRAQTDDSIYSHAAVFQLSDIFSSASVCTFLMVLQESSIVENMEDSYDKDTGMYYFYIDKNTKIYVEGMPFTIDYDIEMRIIKKKGIKGDEYLYSASYIMDEYTNSISNLTSPFISIRRSNNGYIALEINCHQCTRTIEYEPIVSNNAINYPVIDIPFDGKIAGFDVLYKSASDSDYNTQLATQVVYSRPSVNPFCYYRLKDSNTLRITFNTKDGYFSPDFNSELKVILYTTLGADGVFPEYNGNNIQISTDDERYGYTNNYIVAAKPSSGAIGGSDSKGVDVLQQLATEGYATANALTTENDLALYFSDFKYRYGDSGILFIKKRDDIAERVYSAFIVMKNQDYIYKTNCLDLKLNLGELDNREENVYMLDPGVLFTIDPSDKTASFVRDPKKNEEYYKMYLEAIENGTIDYVTDEYDKTDLPSYLDRPASFAEFKRRNGIDDKVSIFDIDPLDYEKLDNPAEQKFMYINPFLIRFKKSPNLVTLYLTYMNQKSLYDFTDQNNESFVQFIAYQLQVKRTFSKKKVYDLTTVVLPSTGIDVAYPVIDGTYDEVEKIVNYKLNDKFNVINNDLRVVMVINDGLQDICFTELYPTEYDPTSSNFTFKGMIETDDHITSTGKLRLVSGTIYRNYDTKEYYKVHDDDATLYTHYNENGEIIEDNVPVDDITEMVNNGILIKYSQVVNMSSEDDILIPLENVVCKIYPLYRRIYSEESSSLVLTTDEQTNNKFVSFDTTFKKYIWTNEYSTSSNPITFIKPLNSVRSHLEFSDFTISHDVVNGDETNVVYENDIMDATMFRLPFIKWDLGLPENEDLLTYFMTSLLSQYNSINNIIKTTLRNVTGIDIKFYNTYGFSKYFVIGEEMEVLNRVNLKLIFDVWFIPGTDLVVAKDAVKRFIKSEVESINTAGMNNLFISNLMRKVELNFAYVDHIRFNHINEYDTSYQSVKNYVTDLNDLTVEERRDYVPELLVTDLDDIIINDYFVV